MTTLADISAAMSEMEKRTQPLFAARALSLAPSSLPAVVAKSSSSSSSVPHSSSAAASRKTLGTATFSVQQQQQQQVQRRKTSLRSQGATRANYRLLSNVVTGHPTGSVHANVSSYGDTDSYENDELQKL